MKTRTSETQFGSEKVTVKHTEPTLEDILVRGVSKERIAKMIVDTLNRHHFLPAIRKAGEVIDGTFTSKTEDGKKREQERAVKIAEQVEEGHVFDILSFMPDERETVPEELKVYWKKAQEMREAAIAAGKENVPTVEEIARKIKAHVEAMPDLPGMV